MRRVSSLVFLVAFAALALPAAAFAGNMDEPVVVVYGDVHIERGEVVDGIYVARGDVRVDGVVDGDVVVFSGNATIGGRVEGDLVTFDGRPYLLPGASVSGDVRHGEERPLISRKAKVGGDVVEENWEDSLDVLPYVGAVALWIGITISVAILGVLLLLIAPRVADAVHARSRERIGPLIAIGLAIAICLPVAAVLAAVTLVGLPLAFLILLALLPLAALAYCSSAWALGRRLVGPPRNRIWAFLAGLAILRALALIPILGFLVGLAAVVFGLGLLGAAIGAARNPEQPTPTPARSPGS
jgi:cytoskeletal protein CcmA (bactofilin family)